MVLAKGVSFPQKITLDPLFVSSQTIQLDITTLTLFDKRKSLKIRIKHAATALSGGDGMWMR
jgi:hypothetical protein